MQNRLKLMASEDCTTFDRESVDMFNRYSIDLSFLPKDGFKIIEIIESSSPDVVVMDLFLPRIDAIGIITTIHKNRRIEMPKFIVISNFSRPALEKEVLSAGATFFMVKPVSCSDIIERIVTPSHFSMLQRRKAEANAKYSANIHMFENSSVKVKITDVLHQIGVPAHIKGYHYLRSSIMMCIENPEVINAVTKQLYPAVAQRFDTTPSRVERAIRHAIEVAWDRGDIDVLNSYFGYTIHNSRGKPTNSEFIAMISDKLSLQFKTAS